MSESNSNEPYLDSEGKPIVALSFCVLADILGISRLCANCTTIAESQELLLRLIRAINETKIELQNNINAEEHLRNWSYSSFSDMIVLGHRISDRCKDAESELGRAVRSLMMYQTSLALHGFFVRGGITFGELHLSPTLSFGKALIKSYCLEKAASNPRIIVSGAIKSLIDFHLTHYSDPGRAPHAKDFVIDEDGEVFVNYLQSANLGLSTDEELLRLHQGIIVEKLQKHRSDNRIRLKYEWLRDYHNFFCFNFYETTIYDGDGSEYISHECDPDLFIHGQSDSPPRFRLLADSAEATEPVYKNKTFAPAIDFAKLAELDDQQFFES